MKKISDANIKKTTETYTWDALCDFIKKTHNIEVCRSPRRVSIRVNKIEWARPLRLMNRILYNYR